ncbi:nucleotide-binding universal stress UspA family protein [Paraburkholderia caballeronis]|uniref:universal stress protein n=1 Tax=Paraburkholderia caballeronis TaxID=416943 RepID=UPI001066FB70|nr:universal stress protein [Paraburkholderia caballeronis]TDV34025.1 nucleotide-binding universal stress UspA family protein [Paraburkholderia caballeronis]
MYSRILVALDGSETASRAFDTALDLARDAGAQLLPLYVIDAPVLAYDVPGYDPSIVRNAFVEEGERIAADARERMAKRGVVGEPRIVEVKMPGEDVAHCIQQAAADWHAQLIVIGTHGRRGVRRMVLGSVAERVLRSATCPVLLVSANMKTAAQPPGATNANA